MIANPKKVQSAIRIIRRVTPLNGGSASIIGELDRNAISLLYPLNSILYALPYSLTGSGNTGSDRCPAALTDRTPNNTLSLLTFSFRCVSAPALWLCVHINSFVARQTTSYVVPAGANAAADAFGAGDPRRRRPVVAAVALTVVRQRRPKTRRCSRGQRGFPTAIAAGYCGDIGGAAVG